MSRQSPSDRRDDAYWDVWSTVLWGLLVAALFPFVQGFIVFWALSPADRGSEAAFLAAAENGTVVSWASYGTTIVCCLLIAGIVRLKKGAALGDYLALQPVTMATALRWLVYLAIAILLLDGLTSLLDRPIVPDVMVRLYASSDPAWLFWIALIVAAPVLEETFFRGFLFRGFQRSYLGTIGAVVLTSALWALVHLQYDAWGITTVFVLGLLLGAARARSNSLVLPMFLHAMTNVVATVETAIAAGG